MNHRFQESEKLYNYGKKYIAGGVNSNFRYTGYGESPVPLYYAEGKGSRLTDVDGSVYIDYALANGPLILGHAPERVLNAVRDTLEMGQLFAGQTVLEAKLAEKLVKIIPCAELVRFASSGTEAIQAAVRLARACTGRKKIIKFEGHYHGWTDSVFISVNPPLEMAGDESSPMPFAHSPGQSELVLKEIITLPWNNLDLLVSTIRQQKDDIAGVIMEPVNCNTGAILPLPGYLEGVREITEQHGIMLIFDEVITGFRVALDGAQGRLGVTPDLAIFAKALAAGFPLAALVGKKEVMELFETRQVMHGGTYNANVMTVAAGLAAIEELEKNSGEVYTTMNRRGKHLMDELQRIATRQKIEISVPGFGTVFHPLFGSSSRIENYRQFATQDAEFKNRFYARLQSNGTRVTARGTWFLSTAHSDKDIDQTLEQVQKTMEELSNENE